MKKYDFYIIILILILGGLFYGIYGVNGSGSCAEIYVDGQLYKTVNLADDTKVIDIESFGGHNVLEVKSDGVKMISADCPGKVCVHTPKQNISGSIIACLPNRVLVKLTSGINSEVDVIAR